MRADLRRGLKEVILHPGQHCVAEAGYRIRTLLGSCVAITLWHPVRRVGAMSHILLPGRPGPLVSALDGRFAEEALCLMLRDLAFEGIGPSQCQAKLFGGAHMFPGAPESLQVGKRNGEAARTLLGRHGIAVAAESLYGIGHRNVIFDVATGDVWARQLAHRSANPSLPAVLNAARLNEPLTSEPCPAEPDPSPKPDGRPDRRR